MSCRQVPARRDLHAASGNVRNKCSSRLRVIHFSDFYGKMQFESIDLFFVGLTCGNISIYLYQEPIFTDFVDLRDYENILHIS